MRKPRPAKKASPSKPDGDLGAVFVRHDRDPERVVRLRQGDRLVVGASRGASLRVIADGVAGEHCLLEHRGDAISVVDLSQGEGTYLYGARVPSALLTPPAVIELGRCGAAIELALAPLELVEVAEDPLPGLVGRSTLMLELSAQVRRFARVKLPVLVRGESGVGKDLVARALHDLGPRSARPFVAINAATISRELAESELFGHQRGAFTGAIQDRRGAFREAHGGTLFIDEIAALPIEVQAKLLRVVEDGVVRPLGGEARTPVDVRLVAATCEPLEDMVERRAFREDLYERLAVCVASVPPLHARAEDIPAIARTLLAGAGFDVRIAPAVIGALVARRYRGNVRELRNILAQCALRARCGVIEPSHLEAVLAARASARRRLSPIEAAHVLEACEGNVSRAARAVRLPRSTLRDLLERAQNVPATPA